MPSALELHGPATLCSRRTLSLLTKTHTLRLLSTEVVIANIRSNLDEAYCCAYPAGSCRNQRFGSIPGASPSPASCALPRRRDAGPMERHREQAHRHGPGLSRGQIRLQAAEG